MTAPGSSLLSGGLGLLLLVILCYVGGRLHQWYKYGLDREEAYRDGYDTATKSLFSLATRTSRDVSIARNGAVERSFQPGVVVRSSNGQEIVRGSAVVKRNNVTPITVGERTTSRARHRKHDSRDLTPTMQRFPELGGGGGKSA